MYGITLEIIQKSDILFSKTIAIEDLYILVEKKRFDIKILGNYKYSNEQSL